jgi:hypothetical protein
VIVERGREPKNLSGLFAQAEVIVICEIVGEPKVIFRLRSRDDVYEVIRRLSLKYTELDLAFHSYYTTDATAQEAARAVADAAKERGQVVH